MRGAPKSDQPAEAFTCDSHLAPQCSSASFVIRTISYHRHFRLRNSLKRCYSSYGTRVHISCRNVRKVIGSLSWDASCAMPSNFGWIIIPLSDNPFVTSQGVRYGDDSGGDRCAGDTNSL